jgi:hypothetical protein
MRTSLAMATKASQARSGPTLEQEERSGITLRNGT